jgi:hypothetical protein
VLSFTHRRLSEIHYAASDQPAESVTHTFAAVATAFILIAS